MTDEEHFLLEMFLFVRKSGLVSFCHVLWELEKNEGASLYFLGSFKLICVTSGKSAKNL